MTDSNFKVDTEPPANPGENKFGKYVLLNKISSNDLYSLHIAYDTESKKTVAIKLLSPDIEDTSPLFKQFRQEAVILKSLAHPNVLSYMDDGRIENSFYLVFDYLKGLSLENFPLSHKLNSSKIKHSIPTLEDYILLFIDCLEALKYIHKRGLVHANIKPKNFILRGNDYKPCLISFKHAKYCFDETRNDHYLENIMLKPRYLSPECLLGKPINHLADLFSFGVIMYEKLTGFLPFDGNNVAEIISQQIQGKIVPLRYYNSSVIEPLEKIILRLLQKEPENRPPTTEILQQELTKVLELNRQTRADLLGGNDSAKIGLDLTISKLIEDGLPEKELMQNALADFTEMSRKLRLESAKSKLDRQRIDLMSSLLQTIREYFESIEGNTKTPIEIRIPLLVIDECNKTFPLFLQLKERRNKQFNLHSVEYSFYTIAGKDIVVDSNNFTSMSKKNINLLGEQSFFGWNKEQCSFHADEEKIFLVNLMIGDKNTKSQPPNFRGFFWSLQFLQTMRKLNYKGISIRFAFKGRDKSGGLVHGETKADVYFSKLVFEKVFDSS